MRLRFLPDGEPVSPAEIAALARFLSTVLGDPDPGRLAAELAEKYVIFERTEPKRVYCDECGFSGGPAGHHPRCTEYSRIQRAAGDKHGFGRTT